MMYTMFTIIEIDDAGTIKVIGSYFHEDEALAVVMPWQYMLHLTTGFPDRREKV